MTGKVDSAVQFKNVKAYINLGDDIQKKLAEGLTEITATKFELAEKTCIAVAFPSKTVCPNDAFNLFGETVAVERFLTSTDDPALVALYDIKEAKLTLETNWCKSADASASSKDRKSPAETHRLDSARHNSSWCLKCAQQVQMRQYFSYLEEPNLRFDILFINVHCIIMNGRIKSSFPGRSFTCCLEVLTRRNSNKDGSAWRTSFESYMR
jgi:hypothetical protein